MLPVTFNRVLLRRADNEVDGDHHGTAHVLPDMPRMGGAESYPVISPSFIWASIDVVRIILPNLTYDGPAL